MISVMQIKFFFNSAVLETVHLVIRSVGGLQAAEITNVPQAATEVRIGEGSPQWWNIVYFCQTSCLHDCVLLNEFSPLLHVGFLWGPCVFKGFQCWLVLKDLHNDALSFYLVILLSTVLLKMLCPLSSCLIQNLQLDFFPQIILFT